MNQNELSIVLGTAGHIDHGKTALVKALTEVDCDRLREEKQRGITIELGFAPLQLADGRVVSIVDVPGHEKFIRQMVAGVTGIDAVLFVVAADEGVMQQTREHLDILRLLGISKGIVVVTKTDLVDPDLLEMALEDIHDLLQGTFLEQAPLVPVSARNGTNIEKLRKEITLLLDEIPSRKTEGPLFLPIDRAFAISGFGTVLTGTAYNGEIKPGQGISVVPLGKDGKVRGVQVHGHSVDSALAGQRVAVNISGISVDEISRGDVLCDKDLFRTTRCLDVEFTLLATAPNPLKHWQRIRLHLGTSDVLARISLLGQKEILPGEKALAQIVTEEPLVCLFAQPFVVRFYSPLQTIGGGIILNPYGHKPRGKKTREEYQEWLHKLAETGPAKAQRVSVLLSKQKVVTMEELSRVVQMLPVSLKKSLSGNPQWGKCLGSGNDMAVATPVYESLVQTVKDSLESFHSENPFLQGMTIDLLIQQAFRGILPRTGRILLQEMIDEGHISQDGTRIRLPDFQSRDNTEFRESAQKILQLCRDRGFQLPELAEMPQAIQVSGDDMKLLLEKLREDGEIAIVGRTFLLSREIEDRLLRLLEEMDGPISLAAIRDRTSSSRKFILPVLEYFDGQGLTRRVGDKRILRKRE